MKRIFDISLSLIGLIVSAPVMIPALIAVWLQDYRSPFYIANRSGKGEKIFKMIKIRSMVVNADKSGVNSTSNSDMRITAVGRFIRKYKLDELSQLLNVLIGDMSLVGPRPNVPNEVAEYTKEEKRLLSVKPGITDISSIVFSDEGAILKDSKNPDADYNSLIRPWKSRLGLLYIDNQSLLLDLKLVFLTALAIVSKQRALKGVNVILNQIGADPKIIEVAKRETKLTPFYPPGYDQKISANL